jgi:hypothetical protein
MDVGNLSYEHQFNTSDIKTDSEAEELIWVEN